jgi:hypothetical protein
MQSRWRSTAAGLSDAELLRRVVQLAGREREGTVELVVQLAELDARKLHVAEGYGSLFAYCTGALRLAEHSAYNRIVAARLSRAFPAILELLAEGALNLSTTRLLAPHLRPDNFESLVAQARGRSKREVEILVARLAPRPDVVASVRRLPERAMVTAAPDFPIRPSALPVGMAGVPTGAFAGALATGLAMKSEPTAAMAAGPMPVAAQPAVLACEQPINRPLVAPLAPERYRVQFTIGARTHDKLRRAQELLRREIPDGDPGAIFDRALTLLLDDVERRKLALTARSQPGRRARPGSRHVPAQVRRDVWLRDGGRCAFVAAGGRRCGERVFLEFHHREPYAIGGEATSANISLRCRAHNLLEAERAFGPRPPGFASGSALDDRSRGLDGRWPGLVSLAAPSASLAGPSVSLAAPSGRHLPHAPAADG